MGEKIIFFFPPQWVPNHPYLAPALLCAIAKNEGVDCRFYDLNLAFYEKIIGKDLIRAFRSSFFDLNQFQNLLSKFEEILKFQSNESFKISLFDFKSKYKIYKSDDILFSIKAKDNIFLTFYEDFFKHTRLSRTQVVGISIISYSQLIPGLTLAYYLRKCFPHIKIIIGGNMINKITYNISKRFTFWNIVDAIALGEGELVIKYLSQSLKNNGRIEWEKIPNVMFFEKKSGKVVITKPATFSLRNYVFPDYSDYRLNSYFAPYPIISIEASRGCYWAKCTFCESTDIRFKKRNIQQLINEVEKLNKQYGFKYFSFADLAIPPASMFEFAEHIIKKKINIYWKGMIRAEKYFCKKDISILTQSGLKMIQLGIESACPKILKIINKGIDIEIVKCILQKFHNAGIWTHGYFIIGLPKEKLVNVQETLRFIKTYGQMLPSLAVNCFVLLRDSDIFRNPSKYDININLNKEEDLRTAYFDFSKRLNISEKSAIKEQLEEIIFNHPFDYNKWRFMDINYLFLYICELGMNFFRRKESVLTAY